MHLLDGAALDTPLFKTPVFSGRNLRRRALASWQDSDGTRWVLAPAGGTAAASAGFANTNGDVNSGAIVAFKVVEQNGAPALEPGWGLARHGLSAAAHRRQWRGLRGFKRRIPHQRCSSQRRTKSAALVPRGTVCPGRRDGQGAMEQRRHHHVVCAQRRTIFRRQPRVCQRVRRNAICLRLPDRTLIYWKS